MYEWKSPWLRAGIRLDTRLTPSSLALTNHIHPYGQEEEFQRLGRALWVAGDAFPKRFGCVSTAMRMKGVDMLGLCACASRSHTGRGEGLACRCIHLIHPSSIRSHSGAIPPTATASSS